MKLEFLFPEICGIYGDAANVKYMAMCSDNIEVINDDFDEEPYFVNHDVDMIYMGAMTEFSQNAVIEKLMPYKKRLKELIDNNTYFLMTYNAVEVFGNYIERSGNKIECLGILDFYSKYDYNTRHNSHFLGKFEDLEIIGFKTQFGMIYDSKEKGLFEIVKGTGNNPKENIEGIRKNNFMGTYLLGPLFIQNPLFVKNLLKKFGIEPNLKFENEILDAYTDRVNGYKHFLLGK
ncbi:MAG: hypothetical protein Q4E33_03485 [Erysipelotrichaceae bacterium]|nr:hypothetical protein [Erysipelotrichaceae bacterium]